MKLTKFEITDHLKTEEDIQEYLNAVIEEGDYKFLPVALDIHRYPCIGSTNASFAF